MVLTRIGARQPGRQEFFHRGRDARVRYPANGRADIHTSTIYEACLLAND